MACCRTHPLIGSHSLSRALCIDLCVSPCSSPLCGTYHVTYTLASARLESLTQMQRQSCCGWGLGMRAPQVWTLVAFPCQSPAFVVNVTVLVTHPLTQIPAAFLLCDHRVVLSSLFPHFVHLCSESGYPIYSWGCVGCMSCMEWRRQDLVI